jgi:hypothetical protein
MACSTVPYSLRYCTQLDGRDIQRYHMFPVYYVWLRLLHHVPQAVTLSPRADNSHRKQVISWKRADEHAPGLVGAMREGKEGQQLPDDGEETAGATGAWGRSHVRAKKEHGRHCSCLRESCKYDATQSYSLALPLPHLVWRHQLEYIK